MRFSSNTGNRKNPFFKFIFIFFIAASVASCNTVDDGLDCPSCKTLERTDIAISGDMNMSNFTQSMESDDTRDLITYKYYGNPSQHIEFVIELNDGYELRLKVYDAINNNPWEQVGQPYNIYPGEDLEDKLQYVNAELRYLDDTPGFATNMGNSIPPGIFLNKFKIIENDGVQIKCKINDMILYKNVDPSKTIHVNGTFVGAITF